MKAHIALTFFLYFLFFGFPFQEFELESQEYSLKTRPLLDKDGFLITTRSNVFIDSQNFVWYNDNKGLYKEAGNHRIFYPFNFPNGETEFKDIFYRIVEANPKEILGTNRQGIFILNKNEGNVQWIYTSKKDNLIITQFYKDFEGNIWFIIEKNILACYTINSKLKTFHIKGDLIFSPVDKLQMQLSYVKRPDHIVLKSMISGELYKYSKDTIEKISLPNFNKNTSKLVSENGQLFPKNKSGTYRVDNKSYHFIYDKVLDAQFYELPVVKNNSLDQSANDGHIFCDNNQLLYFKYQRNDNKFEKTIYPFSERITSFFKSADDDFYVTNINGLNILREGTNTFTPVRLKKRSNREESASFRSIAETNNGTIYAVSYSGWFVKYPNKTDFESIQFFHKDSGDLLTLNLYGFYKVDDETLIAYGDNIRMYRLSLRSKTFTIIPLDRNKLKTFGPVLDIQKIDQGHLLVGGHSGLYVYNIQENKVHYSHPILNDIDLNGKIVEKIYLDLYEQELWLGFKNTGLLKKDLKSGVQTNFEQETADFNLIDNRISNIYPDQNKKDLWIGTYNGLQRINRTDFTSEFIKFKEGPNSSIAGILEDNNDLWVSTFDGLIKFNKKTKETTTFLEEDGLPNNEFNKKSFAMISDSLFFFGGIKGLVAFNPTKIKNTIETRKLFLVGATYFDSNLNKEIFAKNGLNELKKFEIPFAHNYINLKVAVNNPIDTKSAQFQYKVPELKDQWVNAGTQGEIDLQGLSPGSYCLTIRALDRYGSTSNMLDYTLDVNQVFYKRDWFLQLSIFIFMLFVVFYFIGRRNSIRQEMKYHLSRTEALRSQMNPHLIFNALNSIQSTMILDGEKAANDYTVSYGNYIRNSLDITRTNFVSLDQNIQYIKSYLVFEKTRLNENLHYSIIVDPSLDKDNIQIPSMFLQPIIENAIVHGLSHKKDERNLEIQFEKVKESLQVSITDNGIGRKASTKINKTKVIQRKSHGTTILKERIQLINSMYQNKISLIFVDLFESQKAQGTKVILEFPLQWKRTSFLSRFL